MSSGAFFGGYTFEGVLLKVLSGVFSGSVLRRILFGGLDKLKKEKKEKKFH